MASWLCANQAGYYKYFEPVITKKYAKKAFSWARQA
jgi:hypothetical protein